MATKRKTTTLREGDIIDVEEYHDGNYGAKGKKRQKKKKATKEDVQRVNDYNKMKKCRLLLLEYFTYHDIFATWTYNPRGRPEDMKAAIKQFGKAIRIVREAYKKRGVRLLFIRNIERGTKGAWHIHLVVNRIPETESILAKAWAHGGTWTTEIKKSDKLYDEDFTKLASYLTKSEKRVELKEDGAQAKPRIREADWNHAKNMPLPEPEVDKLIRWKKEPKPKKGYYIAHMVEGINPVTGFLYRRYTQIRLNRRI